MLNLSVVATYLFLDMFPSLTSGLPRLLLPHLRGCGLVLPTSPGHRAPPSPTPNRQERVATNSDGSVVICWHPEPKFPYELSRPVPRGKGQPQTESKCVV